MSARSISAPGEDLGGGVQRASAASRAPEKRASGRDPSVPPRAGASFDPVPVGPGKRLPPRLAGEMSSRFSQDFSSVRLHDDTSAAGSADAIDAKAYTIGDDIVLSPATAALDTQAGRRTIAHELTHVVQQRRGGSAPPLSPDAAHETAAEQVATRAVGGQGPLAVQGGTAVGVARDKDDTKKKKAPAKAPKKPAAKKPSPTPASKNDETGIVEEATPQGPPVSPKPARKPSNQDAKDARKEFNRDRDEHAERLGVGKGGQVHHRIEVQALKRYPGVFSKDEINDESAMRGIRPELDGKRQLHNAKIREVWDRHYVTLDALLKKNGLKPGSSEYKAFVRRYMTDAGDEMDYLYGPLYSEAHKGQPAPAAKPPAGKSGAKKKPAAAPTAATKPPGKAKSGGANATTSPAKTAKTTKKAPASSKKSTNASPAAKSKQGPKKAPAKATPSTPKTSPKADPKAAPKVAPKATPKLALKATPTVAPKVAPKTAPKVSATPSPKVAPKVVPKITTPSPTTRTPPPKPATPAPRAPSLRGTGFRAPSPSLRSSFRGSGGRGVGILITMAMAFLASRVEAATKDEHNQKIADADSVALTREFGTQLDAKAAEILTLQATNPFAPVYANVTYDTASEESAIVAGDTLIEDSSYYGTTISGVSVGYLPSPGKYSTRDGSMSRGAWDIHDFETVAVPLSMASIEELVEHARANGIPLKALRAYAYGQMQEAGMSSDGGLGPRMSAYWSQIIADMDSP